MASMSSSAPSARKPMRRDEPERWIDTTVAQRPSPSRAKVTCSGRMNSRPGPAGRLRGKVGTSTGWMPTNGRPSLTVTGTATDSPMKSARDTLQMELDAPKSPCLVIKTGLRDLARRIGIAISGPALERLDENLERLATVTQTISQNESGNPVWRSRMFGVIQLKGSKRLIAINPWLSHALVGNPVTYIDIDEQRALGMDVAKRLHFWMSGWAKPSRTTKPTSLGRFLPHIWGPGTVNDTDNYRMRMLIKAFAEIEEKTLWKCKIQTTEDGSFVRITRPRLGSKPEALKTAA